MPLVPGSRPNLRRRPLHAQIGHPRLVSCGKAVLYRIQPNRRHRVASGGTNFGVYCAPGRIGDFRRRTRQLTSQAFGETSSTGSGCLPLLRRVCPHAPFSEEVCTWLSQPDRHRDPNAARGSEPSADRRDRRPPPREFRRFLNVLLTSSQALPFAHSHSPRRFLHVRPSC
jgi:hypothetical protein